MKAEIISIGTELLMGETVDTNSSWLADELAKIGIDLIWATKVGDHPGRIEEAIARAVERSYITLTTGGLGPTSDDLTRESIAAVMGEHMEVQSDLLERLTAQFESRGIRMPATNIKQATSIPSAEIIPNAMGTAPGWWVRRSSNMSDSIIVALPGPPREIAHMWEREVAPRLRAMNPDVAIATRTLKTFGITEGGLDEMLAPLFESDNPTLGIYSKQDGIHLRAIARAPTIGEAQTLIEPMERQIWDIVGNAVWGEDDDTPVAASLNALTERRLTLAIAEGFTSGMLSASLLEDGRAADALVGSIVLTGDMAARNLLGVDSASPPESPVSADAAALAESVRERLGADVGLAMTGLVSVETAASGPVGTTHIGISVGGDTHVSSASYPARRLRIRARAVTHALLELAKVLDTGVGGRQSRWG